MSTMKFDPQKHHRHSIRLKEYDYSQPGLYYITICCHNRACLFGKVENGKMKLNDAGIMVQNEWLNLTGRFNNIKLHRFVVMPNHFHAILEIVGATLVVALNDNNSSINVVAHNEIIESGNIVDPNKIDVLNNPDDKVNTNISGNQNNGVIPHDAEISNVVENHKISNTQNNIHPDKKGQPQGIAPTTGAGKTVGEMIGAFQSIVTVNYIRGVKNFGWDPFNGKLWQRNYYEHIIRNETVYINISDYITNNPTTWNDDALK